MNCLRLVLFTLALAVGMPFAARAAEALPPAPTHYVTDNEHVLSPSANASIENELRDYEQTTGHQVIVWIGDTTGDTQLEQWTVDAAGQWGIGRKGHDDGAVLFVFMQDHQLRIEVGYGLEPSLTDAQAKQIIDTVVSPKMRAGDYDDAIQDGVDSMLVAITPSFASHIGHEIATPEPAGEDTGSDNPIAFLLTFGFILVCIFFIVFVRSMQYFFILLTRGPAAAHTMWHSAWIASGAMYGGLYGWSSGGDSSGGGFGGFSGGGGGFGGGGASGGW